MPETETDMTEEELRAWISELRSPKLDAFRTRLRSERTSTLLAYQSGDNPYIVGLVEELLTEPGIELLEGEADTIMIAAVTIAINDELDRRIPIPGG